jgi:hypothetical protein
MDLETIKARAKKPATPASAWGTMFEIRTLTGADLDAIYAANGNDATRVEILARALTFAGTRVFDSDEGRAFLRDEADGIDVHRLFSEVCDDQRLGVDAAVKN